jgi:DNA-binding NarL/FixJ family response regulator
MIKSLHAMTRSLSPSEHLVLKCVCTGQSNSAIVESTHFSLKTVENTISRSAKVFGVAAGVNVNSRVLLALAYRANFQNTDFNSTEMAIDHLASLKSNFQL